MTLSQSFTPSAGIDVTVAEVPDLRVAIAREAQAISAPTAVPAPIVDWLTAVVLESLTERQSEWEARGLSPATASALEIVLQLRPGLERFLRDAARTAQAEGSPGILWQHVLHGIGLNFCKIFPFCK